jgi:dTDP-4-amino-4,6-dideoxygalactose transaminase
MERIMGARIVNHSRTGFLPFALPDIGESEFEEVRKVLESGWLTTGQKTREFEKEFATYLGAKHAIAVNSCTAAMHLALEAIGLHHGDFVITTPYTFAASAEVIRYFGATPVFVDIESDTLNMNPVGLMETVQDLRRAMTQNFSGETIQVRRALNEWRSLDPRPTNPRIRAVIPVHIAGHPVEVDRILEIAGENDLVVIEDAAHSLPARYKGRLIGAPLSLKEGKKKPPTLFTCFSFYATKTLTTGEGGMIVTEEDDLAERCRVMGLHGISKDAWKRYTAEGSWYYEIIAPGYKYNFTDIAAALGVAQLHKLEAMWRRRQEIAQRYSEAFCRISELQVPSVRTEVEHSWHLYIIRLNSKLNSKEHSVRNQFIEDLRRRNIGTSVHFIPLHLHPYYRNLYDYHAEDFPVAYTEYQRSISLPIYSRMTDQDVEDVISAVIDVLEGVQTG